MRTAQEAIHSQHQQIREALDTFQLIRESMQLIHEQIQNVRQQAAHTELKQQAIVHAVQRVAAIAEQTAARAQEIGANTELQDHSIRSVAEQSGEIHRLSQQLFQEIERFKIDENQGEEVEERMTVEIEAAAVV